MTHDNQLMFYAISLGQKAKQFMQVTQSDAVCKWILCPLSLTLQDLLRQYGPERFRLAGGLVDFVRGSASPASDLLGAWRVFFCWDTFCQNLNCNTVTHTTHVRLLNLCKLWILQGETHPAIWGQQFRRAQQNWLCKRWYEGASSTTLLQNLANNSCITRFLCIIVEYSFATLVVWNVLLVHPAALFWKAVFQISCRTLFFLQHPHLATPFQNASQQHLSHYPHWMLSQNLQKKHYNSLTHHCSLLQTTFLL